MLRAIPNLAMLRPADGSETIESWPVAMERLDGPTLLVLSRQKLPVLDRTTLGSADGVKRGAYVLLDPSGGVPQAILIATGPRCTSRWRRLACSRPTGCGYGWCQCRRGTCSRLGIEAASAFGWLRWITDDGAMLAMEGFGASAPGGRLYQESQFTPEGAAEIIWKLLARRSA
ncbi:MAG: transketolase-like TK C-terminal-containing protein [Gemmatimonadales bacterium]